MRTKTYTAEEWRRKMDRHEKFIACLGVALEAFCWVLIWQWGTSEYRFYAGSVIASILGAQFVVLVRVLRK